MEESKRLISDHEILMLVQGVEGGVAEAKDLMLVFYPEKKNRFTGHQLHVAYSAFDRVAEQGFLERVSVEKSAKVRGKMVRISSDPGWTLTDAGRHNLMTRTTGATARNILDEIDAED